MSDYSARITLNAYRMVGKVIYPFMGPFLRLRARRGKEDVSRRYERYGYPSAERPDGPLIWFHAASVGETMAVMPLIEHVDRQGINTVLTTGTVTSAEVVRGRLPGSTFHQYVPLDLERAVGRFLDHWKPDLAIFTESEIWPATILELGARQIPQILVNARMSDRSFSRWSSGLKLAEALFDNISHVVAQSEVDAERFRHLGARPVSVCGNLKVDSDSLPFSDVDLSQLKFQMADRPTWIAASTHAGEEAVAMRVHARLKQVIPNLLTIIVPRHPDRADEITSSGETAGLNIVRRSTSEPILWETDIFLGDTIGEMGLYLRLASVAFMGRSLVASGGQNPVEPAMVGAAILTGRQVHNFRDTYRGLLEAGAARVVRDEDMLADNVEFLLSNDQERINMIDSARNALDGMSGAVERTEKVLEAYLFPLTVKRDLEGM
ncbi:MAG: lipid IV(A) 3-deoxy-D-manno-octulosonic acid transferase [Rhizobiaceae bacterium]